jgi:ferric-dicitrate binding protein FerR (iron transport regulator)
MGREFHKYVLEDFLDDADFCEWARSGRPDLDGFYRELLREFPEQTDAFQRACRLISLFDDEKQKTAPMRKLQIWEEIIRIDLHQKRLSGYKQVFRYAAVFFVLMMITSLSWYFLFPGNQDRKLPAEMNQIAVPWGKQSKVVLADRTEVWLNAGSCLVYPSAFDEHKRSVQLQGEAFFKVSKDKTKPFIVKTVHNTIKVQGTSFNVKAYPDDKTEETILAEGSVRIHNGSIFGEEILLKPGQRVITGGPGQPFILSEVDVQNHTSWIDGLLSFKDEPLFIVLERVSRFYDVKIRCEDADVNKKISGKLDLKQDYQRVLNSLMLISQGNYIEKDGIVTFKLNKNDH